MCTNYENWIAIRKLDCNQNWQHIILKYMCVGVYLVTDNLSERFWNLMFLLYTYFYNLQIVPTVDVIIIVIQKETIFCEWYSRQFVVQSCIVKII